ncbi:MAG TPA: DinB family protein [Rubricoccaceae bacterium]|nr:DinB family protein [Rubricoccaceae bacterium]
MPTPPRPDEYAPFYAGYVARVEGDLFDTLEAQPGALAALLDGADPDHAYAPGKWTVRQVVQHTLDAERVFAYRALRFARGDDTPLPGFEENAWAENDPGQPLHDLLAEADAVRAATLALLRAFPEEAWDRRGVASGHPMSVRALAYVIAGHTAHHMAVLRERYLDRAQATPRSSP